ncbi:putative 2OG-Fe(II) oxygenase [Sphingopyxis sp. Geo48]|uniref:putative 2OG-Fe(II) oxygenase n=1 Tax=Sphingopyxis sp. Geo48 TaxID=545241 RepID=UPI0024B777A1|nr:putative 2OG-Fe(II) oxygenase [Sphingopyxis sp. Geo48]
MSFAARLAAARRGQADADDIADLARLALDEGEEEQALPLVLAAASRADTARLWQWAGLLQRGLDAHADAIDSFAKAARLAPDDASIAHGRARVAFEAGLDAVALFEAAERLGPPNGDVLIGLAAARWAAGQGEAAEAALDAIVAQVPLWLQGHMQLAQLRALMGRREAATASFERALAQEPGAAALWRGLLDLHLQREDHIAQVEVVARAVAAGVAEADVADHAAIAAAELGQADRADRLFEALPDEAMRIGTRIWQVRHLLRSGRFTQAGPIVDAEIEAGGARRAAVWPYALLLWRLTDDPRYAWLGGDPGFVRTFDFRDRLPPLDALAAHLRTLHVARSEYLDQSVRGGTQTDGPLFSRIDPVTQALRAAVVGAVNAYLAALPAADPAHPLLGVRRDRRRRFAGSWSVRLRGAGYHENHVHPQGWISSALYVALPEKRPGDAPEAGWLTLGEPQAALGLDLPPTRMVEPVAGRLVLFPSWMWHGTRPFVEGERLTVAFDVAPPR